MHHSPTTLRYDKVTYSELKDRYLHEIVEPSLPFTAISKDKLNAAINALIDLYAKCVTRGDRGLAKEQLKLHQRENIAWERDTVWRQMIGRERRGEGDPVLDGAVVVKEPEKTVYDVPTPVGSFKITRRKIYKVLALVIFVILLNIKIFEEKAANNCFAILSLCTVLWATEVGGFFPFSRIQNGINEVSRRPGHSSFRHVAICSAPFGFLPSGNQRRWGTSQQTRCYEVRIHFLCLSHCC